MVAGSIPADAHRRGITCRECTVVGFYYLGFDRSWIFLQVLKPQLYIASEDFRSEETGKKFLVRGDQVEVLDTSRPEFWLVRRVSRGAEIGFVKSNVLKKESAE